MKKIGITTYCHSGNYGAALQLKATYLLIEKMGHEPVVLNYSNKYEASQNSIRFLFEKMPIDLKVRRLISGYLFGAISKGKNNFSDFYSLMHYTSVIEKVEDLNDLQDIDVFLVGSDQVWNPRITGGYDDVFLLNNEKIPRKISFASSMGSLNFNIHDEEKIRMALSRFYAISVREKIAQTYLKSILHTDIRLVLDPTLMFDRDEWFSLLNINKKERVIKEKYVLIYALGGQFESLNAIAIKIAKHIQAKTVLITLSSRKKKVDYLVNDATPELFVKLISDAEFVVTNSFHGTCFSIINQVPFCSIYYGDNPKRVESLLKTLGLEARMCSANNFDVNNDLLYKNNDIVDVCSMIKKKAIEDYEWLYQVIN